MNDSNQVLNLLSFSLKDCVHVYMTLLLLSSICKTKFPQFLDVYRVEYRFKWLDISANILAFLHHIPFLFYFINSQRKIISSLLMKMFCKKSIIWPKNIFGRPILYQTLLCMQMRVRWIPKQ